ncbi:MAG: NADH-quinone oxidoreductase subunit C [Acidimicrobiales bacterium]
MSATEPVADGEAPAAAPEPELRHGAPVTWSRGQQVLHTDVAGYLKLVKALHDEGFLMCADLTAADYLTYEAVRDVPADLAAERFELVVGLLRFDPTERVRIRVQVPESAATVPSLFELYPGSDALEREVFDMFGIEFEGHPDLTRILMPEDWVGHPLRKDYASGRIPVQFKGSPTAR